MRNGTGLVSRSKRVEVLKSEELTPERMPVQRKEDYKICPPLHFGGAGDKMLPSHLPFHSCSSHVRA